MAVADAENVEEPKKPFWLWLLIAAPFYVLFSAMQGGWATGIGYSIIPLAISGTLLSRARTTRKVRTALVVHVILLVFMAVVAVSSQIRRSERDLVTSCLRQPTLATSIPADADRNAFCGCYADALKVPATRVVAVAFVTMRPKPAASSEPDFVATMKEAATQCFAKVQG